MPQNSQVFSLLTEPGIQTYTETSLPPKVQYTLHLFLSLCVHRKWCVFVCSCVCGAWGPKIHLECHFSGTISTLPFEIEFLTNWELATYPRVVASEPQDFVCLYFPSTKIINMPSCSEVLFFIWVLGIELGNLVPEKQALYWQPSWCCDFIGVWMNW